MGKLVHCQCGQTIRGDDDDRLVDNVRQHAQEVHNGMEITREQVLAMAQPED
jgi:predicted small metal-binding protein